MLRAILNKSWRQQIHKNAASNLEQVLAATPHLYGHLSPITKTIQVRRTRHAEHCWRSRDELIRDVLLWTPTHGSAKAGRPARTYIQQLCEDMGCCPEDLPEVMNDREKWWERVRDIRVTSMTWWWWWYISKLADCWQEWLESSLFKSYHTKVWGRVQFLSLYYSAYTWSVFVMLSVKQAGIKYHFLSLWYDSTWDRTSVSWTIGKSLHIFKAMG